MSLYIVKRAFIDVIKLSIFRWKISLVYLDGSNIIMCPYEREARMSGAKNETHNARGCCGVL